MPRSSEKMRVYASILEAIFKSKYKDGMTEVDFNRHDIDLFAKKLRAKLPKNPYDLPYSFRYRAAMPSFIASRAGKGRVWIIRGTGPSRYRLVSIPDRPFVPSPALAVTKIPDATPGVIARYALTDEQALLAVVRYNRLIDIFSGVACYSLQNHLKTMVRGIQSETDEVYVGIDKRGSQFVFPVQAKGGRDRLNVVQIEQDIGMCGEKFANLICRPIGTQFMKDGIVAMFEFEEGGDGISVVAEKHYQLVPPDQISDDDLRSYQERLAD